MRYGIHAHPSEIDASNIEGLRELSFVFLCIDDGPSKKLIVSKLEAWGTPFVDVGMGLYVTDDKVGGVLRVTASDKKNRKHVHEKGRISFGEPSDHDEYRTNIQIADLNAANAILAVIKWKKMMGFYLDLEREYHSTYTIDGNIVINEDRDDEE